MERLKVGRNWYAIQADRMAEIRAATEAEVGALRRAIEHGEDADITAARSALYEARATILLAQTLIEARAAALAASRAAEAAASLAARLGR